MTTPLESNSRQLIERIRSTTADPNSPGSKDPKTMNRSEKHTRFRHLAQAPYEAWHEVAIACRSHSHISPLYAPPSKKRKNRKNPDL